MNVNEQIMSNQSKQRHLKDFQMQFLSRQSSRKHVEIQEQLLQQSIRKQSSRLLRSSGRQSSKDLVLGQHEKDRKNSKKLFVDKISSDKSKKKQQNKISAFKAEEEPQPIQTNKLIKKYKFSIISYFIEVIIAYGLTIGIFYLIQAGNFPYFQILFVIGLMNSITPWSFTNLILLSAALIIIANNYLFVSILTYPAIIIVYFSVMIFNEEYKTKIMFIFVLVLLLAFGFAMIPGIYSVFSDDNKFGFYYLFPFLMFILRSILAAFYNFIGYSEYLYLQIPFFIMGLQYGVILTLSTTYIQYWYLMVFFTLQVVNQRTQFTLSFMVSAMRSCENYRKGQPMVEERENQKQKRNIGILQAHASGYSSVHSLHIVCLIYIFAKLPIYSSPYTSDTCLRAFVQDDETEDNNLWYMPLCTWALVSVYQLISLVLQRKRKDKLLYGFSDNEKLHTGFRGLMLVIGFWMFYLGLGIGNHIFYPFNTRIFDTSTTLSACI